MMLVLVNILTIMQLRAIFSQILTSKAMIRIRIDRIVEKTGKNLSDIARETGINRNTIQSLALGKVNGIKFETLEKLCSVYGLTIADILDRTVPQKAAPIEKHELYKQEGECVPFTAYPPTFSIVTYDTFEKNGSSLGAVQEYFKGTYMFGYWDATAMRPFARAFYAKHSHRAAFDALYTEFLVHGVAIDRLYRKTFTNEIAALDKESLCAFLDHVFQACVNFWRVSIMIDTFDVGIDQEIIGEIRKKCELSNEDVQVLTTPSELTFSGERKRRLFDIIDTLKARTWTRARLTEFVSSSEDIQRYRMDFDFVESNYATVKHMTDESIVDEIWTNLQRLEEWKKESQELRRYEKDHEAAIATIVRQRKLKENPLWFFERLTIWRENRKKVNLMSIHVLDAILGRVEALTGIPKTYLQYLVPDEVPNVLKGLVPIEELKKRREEGVMMSFEGTRFDLVHGEQADSLRREYDDRLGADTSSSVINGQTACQGYAKGVARIILDVSQFERFNEGEILVTGMTRPEFLPLMKRAAGIVTNEGGITCHAAIVSRELGKPCIIGTKNATTRIPDGATIEVRANHGTVRIL